MAVAIGIAQIFDNSSGFELFVNVAMTQQKTIEPGYYRLHVGWLSKPAASEVAEKRYACLRDSIVEVADLDTMIASLVSEIAPELVARQAIGCESAAQLLLTAGDNPERLKSEASFAALCGISPVPASSGKVTRHRLNHGGDRAANSALHLIAIGRLRVDPRTQAYIAKRVSEGHSKLEAIRCLKRYIARKVYYIIRSRNHQIARTQIAT